MSEQKGHPKGLYLIFVTGMWERFSYYGMRAIFALYMIKALLLDKTTSSEIYGSYTGLVYLTPLLGGYMADRYWGNRKSVIVGGILMAIGQFFMFGSGMLFKDVPTATLLMYFGLAFLIFGNGFFKPNITTMVGDLYHPRDSRKDAAYTIFYMGINMGAFIAPLVCGWLGDTGNPADFAWGFLAAGIGMLVSVVIFEMLKNKYIIAPDGSQVGTVPAKKVETIDIDTSKEVKQEFTKQQLYTWGGIAVGLYLVFNFLVNIDAIGSIIFSLTVAVPGLVISDKSLTKEERSRIGVIYIIAFFVIFFWSAFEQAGISLTYFGDEQTERHLFGWEVPASYFQSINPVAIVLFAPVFVWIWGFLNKMKMEPASPYKQAFGLFFLAVGYLVIAFGVKGIQPGVKVSMIWLTSLYIIHTFGELCLSPIGLSMVNKLSPIKFSSLLMGIWYMSNSAANKFAGVLSALYPEGGKVKHIIGFAVADLYDFFMVFVVMAGVAAVILFLLSKKLLSMMHGVR